MNLTNMQIRFVVRYSKAGRACLASNSYTVLQLLSKPSSRSRPKHSIKELSMTQKKPIKSEEQRKTALCYIRQSFTRDGNDKDSPERQRANIQAVCQRMGWTAEFYEDAEG